MISRNDEAGTMKMRRTVLCVERPGDVSVVTFDYPEVDFPIGIEQSAGTRCWDAALDKAPEPGYARTALVPIAPWEHLRVEPAWESRDNAVRPFVGVWRLSDNKLANFERLLQNSLGDLKCFVEDADNVRRISAPILQYIHERFPTIDGELIFHGIAVSAPGLTTVTRDPAKGGVFIGLHIDSWDHLPFCERHRSLYRISVNIGCEPRYFLFAPIDVLRMRDLLLETAGEEAVRGKYIPQLFLSTFPALPIRRLRIEPGEAYIAPTDLLVHDGSTLCATGPSAHLTVRGRFRDF
jgi:hypothetical protein